MATGRPFQFTLRSYLIVVGLLCTVLGLATRQWHHASVQRQCVDELRAMGCRVSYRPGLSLVSFSLFAQADSVSYFARDGQPAAFWQRIGCMPELTRIDFQGAGCPVTTADLHHLARHHALRQLSLTNCFIDPAAFCELAGCRQFETLSLANSHVNDEGCQILADSCPNLRELNLFGTVVTDVGIAELARLPQLAELDLCATPVRSVENLPRLSRLVFPGGYATDGRFRLARLPRLRSLSIDCLELEIEDLPLLRELRCRGLDRLTMTGTGQLAAFTCDARRPSGRCDEQVLEPLAACPNLQRLDLGSMHLTNKGLAALGQIASAESVDLSGCEVTADRFDLLAAMPRLLTLTISEPALLADHSQMLAQCPMLRSLVVCYSSRDPVLDCDDFARLLRDECDLESASTLGLAMYLFDQNANNVLRELRRLRAAMPDANASNLAWQAARTCGHPTPRLDAHLAQLSELQPNVRVYHCYATP